jgi:hypothetical protein
MDISIAITVGVVFGPGDFSQVDPGYAESINNHHSRDEAERGLDSLTYSDRPSLWFQR